MPSTLANKIALVPGGATGLAFTTAQNLVSQGAYVYITGTSRAALERAATSIGPNVTAVECDVSRLSDLDRLLARIIKDKGRLDMVVADNDLGDLPPAPDAGQAWSADSMTRPCTLTCELACA